MVHINLLGEKTDHSGTYAIQIASFLFAIVLAGVGCYQHYDSVAQNIESAKRDKSMLESRVVKLRERTKKVDELEQNKKVLREKLMTIAKLKAKKQGPVRLLNDVADSIPERAWLFSIIQKSEAVEFEGIALDNQTVSLFMRNLEKSNYLKAIDLVDSSQNLRDGVSLQKFIISAQLKNPLEPEKVNETNTPAGPPAGAPALPPGVPNPEKGKAKA